MQQQFKTSRLFRPTFNYFEEIYTHCLRKYHNNPKYSDYRRALADTSNGRKILQHDEEVDTYIALYGAQHYHKLNSAYDTLDLSRFEGKTLEIFSYGCGPATDTCVLISYSISKQINLNIQCITLIEPSYVSLNQGERYVQSTLTHNQTGLKIRKINKTLEYLDISDISSQPQNAKLHIFSNILDIEQINLAQLANLLKDSQKGANYFICISPKLYNGKARIDQFCSIMSGLFNISHISVIDEGVRGRVWRMKEGGFVDNQYIDRYQRIFRGEAS